MAEKFTVTLSEAVNIFSENRRVFYKNALVRVRDKKIVDLVLAAVDPVEGLSHEEAQALNAAPLTQSDYENALLLRDIYKKPNFGAQGAATVVSIAALLKAGQDIEEGGLLLYRHICHLGETQRANFQHLEQFHEACLLRLVELEDRLRYHRIRLV